MHEKKPAQKCDVFNGFSRVSRVTHPSNCAAATAPAAGNQEEGRARAASEAVSKAAKQVLLLLRLKMTIPWSLII